MGCEPARDRTVDCPQWFSQALSLHHRKCRHVGLFQYRTGHAWLAAARAAPLADQGRFVGTDDRGLLVLILRLAILFHRNRLTDNTVNLKLSRIKQGFCLEIAQDWLARNPLTAAELDSEQAYWDEIGVRFRLDVSA